MARLSLTALAAAGVLLLFALCTEGAPAQSKPELHRRNNITRPSGGVFGVDVSSPYSQDTFACLLDNGYTVAIVRAYQSTGNPDPNAPQTIANAWAAGLNHVDAYLFPCPQCDQSAAQQVDEMVNSLGGTPYGMIWLDIEGAEYWLGDYSSNQAFFEELLSAALSQKSTGVYASAYQWSSIFGSDYTGGGGTDLWYAHYDGNAGFDDFSPFGPWSSPNMKQFAGDASVCGADVDLDWYPD
ncbi:hypothetical protein EMCRGX_G008011 [Ephydatia muelleri]|eukprot:Em0002g514a